MSRGFVKDYEDQWLHEISPTLSALISFLTYENNGIRVYEKLETENGAGITVHQMSNGVSYFVNDKNQWEAVEVV